MKRILYTLLGIMLTTGAWAENVAQIGKTEYATLQAAITAATTGQTVQLIANVEGSLTIPAGKNVILDLNGHTITASGTAITNNGTLTIKDTQGTGTITSTGNYGICAGSNSTTTIESGNIVSQEFGIGTSYNTGATINVTGGTITARDNAVFGGNGTARDGEPNTFNISGGTFYGEIQSSGYVACGIYSPWKDVFNVSGGTFNITNGCGILGRAGTINVTGGIFNCTGTAMGKVGDSRVVVPCSPIVFDTAAGYPAMTAESNITIPSVSTATFTSADGVDAVTVVAAPETPATHIKIAGGTYSSAVPEDCCNPDFKLKDNGDGTYGVIERTYIAQIGDKKYESLDEAIAAAEADQTITLLTDATATEELLENVTINANSHVVTLPTFNVADGSALAYANVTNATDNTYKVTTATYDRTGATGTQWGTACLPFSIETAPAGYTLYTPSEVSSTTLTVTEVGYPVPVGTPVIFYKNNTGEATITSSNASVKIDAVPVAQSGTIVLAGTFTQQTITSDLSNIYYINGNAFHQAKASLTVPAYRAYIKNTAVGAKPSVLNLFVDDNEATAATAAVADMATAETICDINGRQLSAPQKGINIIKLANGKTLKLIIK